MRGSDRSTDSMEVISSKRWAIAEDRGAWHAAVREVSKSQTGLSSRTAMGILIDFFIKRVAFLGTGLPSKPVAGIGWGSPVLVELCAPHLTYLCCQLTPPHCRSPPGHKPPTEVSPLEMQGWSQCSSRVPKFPPIPITCFPHLFPGRCLKLFKKSIFKIP